MYPSQKGLEPVDLGLPRENIWVLQLEPLVRGVKQPILPPLHDPLDLLVVTNAQVSNQVLHYPLAKLVLKVLLGHNLEYLGLQQPEVLLLKHVLILHLKYRIINEPIVPGS